MMEPTSILQLVEDAGVQENAVVIEEGGAFSSSMSATDFHFCCRTRANAVAKIGRMSTLTNMAEPILQMLLPHHQAMCRSAGPELAKSFASLVHAKVVPAYALPNHKVVADAVQKVPSNSSAADSSTNSSTTVAAVAPIQVQLSRLPRPQSTIAYIHDIHAVGNEADVVSIHESSPVTNDNTNSSTTGESVCTSFPTELSFMNACRRPGAPPSSRQPKGSSPFEQLTLMSKVTNVPPTQESPRHGTSMGTLDWLTDQHASSNTHCKSVEDGGASTSNNGISASNNGGISTSGGSLEGKDQSSSGSMLKDMLDANVEDPGLLFIEETKKRLHTHILSMAPVSVESLGVAGIHVVVNVEALALSEASPLLVATKPRLRSRNPVSTVRILDGFCSNLNAKSVEFTGMAKVVSIGSGFLAGSFVESVSYGPMPRLRSVGDDWMYLCSRLRSVTFSGDCYKLKTIGSCWMCECGSLLKFSHTAFESVERVGSWWLARCDSLESASFNGMPNLKSVGDWWLSSCAGLEHTNYEELSSLTTVGSGWMYACVSITEVSFSGLISLREVGDSWVSDCTFLASVSHGGLGMLREVGAYWLSGCCLLNRVSMVGVERLSCVGPYWLANTCAPHVECNPTNSGRISALIDLSHDVLTQRGRIDPKMKVRLLSFPKPDSTPSRGLSAGSLVI